MEVYCYTHTFSSEITTRCHCGSKRSAASGESGKTGKLYDAGYRPLGGRDLISYTGPSAAIHKSLCYRESYCTLREG